jgi:hypothetical protein
MGITDLSSICLALYLAAILVVLTYVFYLVKFDLHVLFIQR